MSGETQKLLPLFARYAAKVPLVGDEGEAPPPSTLSRSVPAQLVIPSLPRGRPAPARIVARRFLHSASLRSE